MNAKTAKVYIFTVCVLMALIVGYAGPAMFLGEYFPIPVEEPSLMKMAFSLYFWGSNLMPERKIQPEELLAVNTFTCVVWGIVVGWIITMIAVKKNTVYRRNSGESNIKSYS